MPYRNSLGIYKLKMQVQETLLVCLQCKYERIREKDEGAYTPLFLVASFTYFNKKFAATLFGLSQICKKQ